MNSNILFTSTINDYLVLDQTGAYLNTLADNFCLSSFDLLQEISKTLENDKHDIWLSHMHTLKGAAGIAGAKNLHDICDKLRSRNKNDFIDSKKYIMRVLCDAIDEYQDAVHQKLNTITHIKNETRL